MSEETGQHEGVAKPDHRCNRTRAQGRDGRDGSQEQRSHLQPRAVIGTPTVEHMPLMPVFAAILEPMLSVIAWCSRRITIPQCVGRRCAMEFCVPSRGFLGFILKLEEVGWRILDLVR